MLPTPPPRLESFNVVLRETVSGASTTTPLSQLKKIKKSFPSTKLTNHPPHSTIYVANLIIQHEQEKTSIY